MQESTHEVSEQPTPTEIELKLVFPADARDRLEHHPALASGLVAPPKRQRLVTTYFDTPDHRLATAGFTLRVRRTDSGAVQTVKAEGGDPAADDRGPARRRAEWEWPVAGDHPDLSLLRATPLASIVGDGVGARLAPLLTTDVIRQTRRLRLEDASVVEAALDDGWLRGGGPEEPLHELELEVKEGPVLPVYRLALALQADVPMVIGTESKAARGLRLLAGRSVGGCKAADVELPEDVTGAEAFRRMIAAALSALLGNLTAAATGGVEGVHQMRVALRRLRAILVLFEPHLEPHAAGRFTDEVRRLGQVLGEKRDWDVLCLETLPQALTGDSTSHWLPVLTHAVDVERAAAQARLNAEFGRPALTTLAIGLSAWAGEAADILGDEAMGRQLINIAPGLLDRLDRRVRKRGRHIAALAPPELHALRKSLKKLRYAIDDLASLYPARRVHALTRHCKRLQTLLGNINDATVAVNLVQRLTDRGSTELIPALAPLGAWSDRHRADAASTLSEAWEEFADAPRFWR